MNKNRSKKISEMESDIYDLTNRIKDIVDEEAESLDSVPENLRNTEKYESDCDILSYLEEMVDNMLDLIDIYDKIIELI